MKSLGWHPDGTRLATVGADGTCRVFSIAHATQTWVLEHEIPPEIVATGWSGDGRRLMVASSAGKLVKIFDASRSLALEIEEGEPPAEIAFADRLTQACAWIEQHPGEEFGWLALAQAVTDSRAGGADAQADLLLAAADLGVRALFSPLGDGPKQTALATVWHGVELPRAVQVAQAGALKRWRKSCLSAPGGAACIQTPRGLRRRRRGGREGGAEVGGGRCRCRCRCRFGRFVQVCAGLCRFVTCAGAQIPAHSITSMISRSTVWRGSVGAGQAPVAAVSLVSNLRRPAPMLMAVEPQP